MKTMTQTLTVDSTEQPSVMTRGAWIDFCMANFLSEHLTDEYWGDLYRNIDDSRISKNFFSYPFAIQKTIIRQLRDNRPVSAISAYIDLCNRVESKHKELTDCSKMQYFEISSAVEKIVGTLSKDFFNACEGITYTKDLRSHNPHAPADMVEAFIYLMVVLYGDRTVLEILNSWESHRGWADPCDLISLADNWSEMREYPLDWALQVTRQHKV